MRKSVANLEAQLEAERARSQGLAEQLESCKRELARKEAVLRSTQQFLAKYKKQARGGRRSAAPGEETQAQRTYWYHPESECAFYVDGDVDETTAMECVELSHEEYKAKYKAQAAPSDRRAAMEAAKAEAMRTGRCVAVAL